MLKRKYSASYRAAFRRQWSALVAAVGPLDTVPLLRLDASRICTLAVELERASDELATAQGQRDSGKGRRPGAARVDRLAHRMLTANAAHSEALAAFTASPEVRLLMAKQAQATHVRG